jgi:hypothetical protein
LTPINQHGGISAGHQAGIASVSDYAFFAAMLRFVAAKTLTIQGCDPRTTSMMAVLGEAARAAERGEAPQFEAERLELAARAYAGFAAFLQKQILPEAVAHANAGGEAQVRWAVDTAMETVNLLLSKAALGDGQAVRPSLPPPPEVIKS